MTTSYVGIDQGLTGAVAWIVEGKGYAVGMPTTVVGRDKTIDPLGLHDLLEEINRDYGLISGVVVERTQKQPRFGCKGNWSAGRSSGIVLAVLSLMRRPWVECQPRTWQTYIGIAGAEDKKEAALQYVRSRFPAVTGLKRGDGAVDALCLAQYAAHTFG